MLEIIVCDDDKSCRKAVVGIVEQFFTGKQMKYIIHEYGDYNDSFIENIVPGGKKIYILDIETPSRSGIDVARMIRKKDVESIIIFVTGYEEFSRLVLKKNIMCLSFINKFDNLAGDLRESLEESLHFFDTDKVFRITDNNVTYNIRLNSILYITRDSLDRRTVVKCDKCEYRLRMSLADVHKLLGDKFIQTHRSCFVNQSRIESVDHKNKIITFDNHMTTDLLSDTYRKDLKQ